MSQTTVQKSQAVRIGSGVLKIDGTNIGLLDNAKMVVEYNTIQIRAHNGYLPAKKKPSSVKITCEIYEIDPTNLALVDWGGVATTVAGTPVNVTGEVLNTWVVGTPIKLANKNGDGTVVTSIVVTGATAGTDYDVVLLNGDTYIVPTGAKTAPLNVAYTYTPNAKTVYTIKDVARALETHELRLENTDENGKKFSMIIPKGYSSGNLDIGLVSDDSVDEATKLPIEFTAQGDDMGRLVYIEDEQG